MLILFQLFRKPVAFRIKNSSTLQKLNSIHMSKSTFMLDNSLGRNNGGIKIESRKSLRVKTLNRNIFANHEKRVHIEVINPQPNIRRMASNNRLQNRIVYSGIKGSLSSLRRLTINNTKTLDVSHNTGNTTGRLKTQMQMLNSTKRIALETSGSTIFIERPIYRKEP